MIRVQKVYFLVAAAFFPVGTPGAWSSIEGDGGTPSGAPSASADGSVGVGSLQYTTNRSLELIERATQNQFCMAYRGNGG